MESGVHGVHFAQDANGSCHFPPVCMHEPVALFEAKSLAAHALTPLYTFNLGSQKFAFLFTSVRYSKLQLFAATDINL